MLKSLEVRKNYLKGKLKNIIRDMEQKKDAFILIDWKRDNTE